MAKRCGFPPNYKIERVEKLSAKRVFFGVLQKIMVICCAIFFGFANAFSANLPSGYTELEYIGTNHNAYIMTNFTVNDFDRVVADIKLYDNDTELNSKQYPHLFGVSADATSGGVQAKVFRFFNPSVSSMYAAYNDKWASVWGGTWAPQSVPLNNWHKFDIKLAAGEQYIKMDTSVVATGTMSSTLVNSYKLPIFAMSYAGNIMYLPHLDSKEIKMYLGDTLVANFVPAKNSSGVVGMYDTVGGQFYTSRGTGEFTAGPVVLDPCRNLLNVNDPNRNNNHFLTDGNGTVEHATFAISDYIAIPAGTTTLTYSTDREGTGLGQSAYAAFYTANKTYISSIQQGTDLVRVMNVPNNAAYIKVSFSIAQGNWQLEVGSTATAYVPYSAACHNENSIKIATTAYNAARFNSVQTDLNNAVATIREIVTKTINQTAAIASLQADKQTRPEDACPAGKKCLLVETEENGVVVPHWFPIVENICGVPSGYTCLDYIQASGTQYIDTGIVPTLTSGAHIRAKFLALKSSDNIIFGATDSTAFAGGKPMSIDVFKNQVLMPLGGRADNSINYTSAISQTMTTNVLYDFKMNYLNDKKAVINDVVRATYTAPVSMTSKSLMLFNLNSSAGGISQYAATKSQIFSAVITDGSNIVFNGVPAKRDSDGVIGVYDTVSDRFLTNAGTGTFTAGPEI